MEREELDVDGSCTFWKNFYALSWFLHSHNVVCGVSGKEEREIHLLNKLWCNKVSPPLVVLCLTKGKISPSCFRTTNCSVNMWHSPVDSLHFLWRHFKTLLKIWFTTGKWFKIGQRTFHNLNLLLCCEGHGLKNRQSFLCHLAYIIQMLSRLTSFLDFYFLFQHSDVG